MGPFGYGRQRADSGQEYGRDSILLLRPFLAAFMSSSSVADHRLDSQTRAIEDDGNRIARQRYRIGDTRAYRVSLLGIAYQKVTKELIDPRK